jgi:hypothetical protein
VPKMTVKLSLVNNKALNLVHLTNSSTVFVRG